jgi:hypothetical protein
MIGERHGLTERGTCVTLTREEGRWAIYKEQDLGQPPLLIGRCLSQSTAVRAWLRVTAAEADD